jgi:transposase
MSKRFRECSLEQPFLLPPVLQEWLPEDHLARFVAEVADALDLRKIYAAYERKDGRGLAAYHPLMLTRVLLYAYATGRASSRKIEQATYDDIAFRYLAANQHPDHDTIAQFRQQHLEALAELFVQALRLCQRAGLVKLANVAIDGTKIKANASTHRSHRHAQMKQEEEQLRKQVERMLEEAQRADEEEDRRHGPGNKGGPLPAELATVQQRIERLREAQRELEEEARSQAEQAERESAPYARRRGRPRKDDPPVRADADHRRTLRKRAQRMLRQASHPQRQYNFTDPDSRVMLDNGAKAYVQAYNAQVGVDAETHVIVAADVTQQVTDQNQLAPMARQVRTMTEQTPACITADAGYWNGAQLADPGLAGIELLIAPERTKPTGIRPRVSALALAMRERLKQTRSRKLYAMRQASVEPVLGQIKQIRGFRQFLLRGWKKVRAEWRLICLTHNLLKLYRATA